MVLMVVLEVLAAVKEDLAVLAIQAAQEKAAAIILKLLRRLFLSL